MQKQALFERWLQTALSSKAREIEPSSDMWEHIRIGISTKDERGIIAFWKNLANHLFLWQPVWKKVLVGAICGILLMSGLTLSFSPQARALAMEVLDTLGIIIKGDSFGNFSKAGAVVVSGPWGKEAGQFGGAGSFAVNKVGNIYILDQANERVQIFDAQGKFKSKFAIELEAPDYIAVDASGATYITDFWDAREVYVYSRDGKLIDKAPISQSITAIRDVITRGNEAFVIDDWTQAVHKLATSSRALTPAEQDKVQAPGLWQGDLNNTIKLFGSQENSTNILIQDEQGNDRVKTHISSHRRILTDSLQVDRKGNIYLFAVAIKYTLKDGVTDSQVVLLKVNRDGKYVGEIDIPAIQFGPSWRPFFVSGSGDIYQMQTDDQGLKIVKWTL